MNLITPQDPSIRLEEIEEVEKHVIATEHIQPKLECRELCRLHGFFNEYMTRKRWGRKKAIN